MDNLPKKKPCFICDNAITIAFVALNLFCNLTDRYLDPRWICLQVIVGVWYLFTGFKNQEIDIETTTPRTMFLFVFLSYLLATTLQLLFKDNMNDLLLSYWLSSTTLC